MSKQTIAVVGVMEQEIALLCTRMEEVWTLSFDSSIVCTGRYAGKHMVLALSGIGKANVAVATAWAVHQFNPDCAVNTDSAGGLSKGLKVGNVVTGDKAAHHDADVIALGYEWGQAPRLPTAFDADERLVGAAEQAASVFEGVLVRHGLTANGNQFIHNSGRMAEIRSRFPGVQAAEMEVAVIVQTCTQLGAPLVVIHAAFDSVDERVDISSDESLKTAAVHSVEVALEMMERF